MLTYYINEFVVFSFLGWVYESIFCTVRKHHWQNRGFLFGPVCPIYGTGVVLITVSAGALSAYETSIGTTFVLSFLLCGTVEYLTSYVMEKRFHARWWDYSQKPMNLHGRVWIGNLLLFGLAGIGIIHILNPFLLKLLAPVPINVRKATATVLLAVLAADFVISYFVLKLVKDGIDSSEADNTEEISKEVRQLLTNKSYFYKRFSDAYPEVIYKTERVQARLAAVKAEAERMRQEAEKRLLAQKEKVAASLEPVHMIRTELIGTQDQLISLLYDEKSASEEMKRLKAEIDRQKGRLENRAFVRHPYGKSRENG